MSGRLIKVIDGNLVIAYQRVAAPGYTIYVEDAASSNGWTYYADELEKEDFALPWKQPTGVQDAYAIGAIVSHNDIRWRSLITGNVWEPGVSGWANISDDIPAWIQPTGAHDAYAQDAVVTYNDKIWRSLIAANVWAPGVSGWRETALMPPSGEVLPPAWVQPTGAHDAYQQGDRVTHNGHTWVSNINANVWEPGVYGWTQE